MNKVIQDIENTLRELDIEYYKWWDTWSVVSVDTDYLECIGHVNRLAGEIVLLNGVLEEELRYE